MPTDSRFSIMQLPDFWLGALAVNDSGRSKDLLKILLCTAMAGEDVIATPEFAEWLGYNP